MKHRLFSMCLFQIIEAVRADELDPSEFIRHVRPAPLQHVNHVAFVAPAILVSPRAIVGVDIGSMKSQRRSVLRRCKMLTDESSVASSVGSALYETLLICHLAGLVRPTIT